jgi:hypothetical protein
MFGMFGTSLELHPLPWSHQRWAQRGCLDVDSMEQPPRETASEHNSKMHVASCKLQQVLFQSLRSTRVIHS